MSVLNTREITDLNEKSTITREVMHALPEWFSPPEDIEQKAVQHRDMPFFAAFDENGQPAGFTALKIHNPYTLEIYVLGALKPYHRTGIGRALVAAAEAYGQAGGYRFLTVKTLDASADYEPYEATRAFYYKVGFSPLEVFPLHWNADNPCLFLAKYIPSEVAHEKIYG